MNLLEQYKEFHRPKYPGEEGNLLYPCLGFTVSDTFEQSEYWCTPTNVITFGYTGGDGIHISALCTNPSDLSTSPIVYTNPTIDTPNFIVGSNLEDFLRISASHHFDCLENITNINTVTNELLETHYPKHPLTLQSYIDLRNAIPLEPHIDIASHLLEVQHHSNRLLFSEEYYEMLG